MLGSYALENVEICMVTPPSFGEFLEHRHSAAIDSVQCSHFTFRFVTRSDLATILHFLSFCFHHLLQATSMGMQSPDLAAFAHIELWPLVIVQNEPKVEMPSISGTMQPVVAWAKITWEASVSFQKKASSEYHLQAILA